MAKTRGTLENKIVAIRVNLYHFHDEYWCDQTEGKLVNITVRSSELIRLEQIAPKLERLNLVNCVVLDDGDFPNRVQIISKNSKLISGLGRPQPFSLGKEGE